MLPSQGRSLVPRYYSSKQEPLSRTIEQTGFSPRWSLTTSRPWSRTSKLWCCSRIRCCTRLVPLCATPPFRMTMSLVAVLKAGRSAEMAVYGREGALGLVGTMVAQHSFGRCIVQASGTASRIELEHWRKVITSRPKVRQLVLQFSEAMMARVLQNVACNAVHSVEERCCRWILSLHDRLDQDTVPLTHEFLADMLGVQRSTVSSITRALQAAGLIRQGRGLITVIDRTGLEGASCECYGTVRRSFERLLPHTYVRDAKGGPRQQPRCS